MAPRPATAILLAMLILPFVAGCDPEGRKDCVWVLEAEETLAGTTSEGFIPVCARNRQTMKQDCRLQTTLDFAKKVQGRTFRYVDLRVASPGIPRTITDIKFCDRKG